MYKETIVVNSITKLYRLLTSVKFEAVQLHLTANGMHLALNLLPEPNRIEKSYFILPLEQRLSSSTHMNIDLPVSLLPPARGNEIILATCGILIFGAFVAYLCKTKERGAGEDESFQNYQIVPSSVSNCRLCSYFKLSLNRDSLFCRYSCNKKYI
jgi:hypothetical protein